MDTKPLATEFVPTIKHSFYTNPNFYSPHVPMNFLPDSNTPLHTRAINLPTSTSLGYGRKQEHLREILMITGNMCKLHTDTLRLRLRLKLVTETMRLAVLPAVLNKSL